MMKRFKDDKKGSIAAITIIVSAILFILGVGAIKITNTVMNTDANYRNGVAAQYLAEAGAQLMYVQLMANPNNVIPLTTVTKNAGTNTSGVFEASVTVNPSNANQFILYSKGTVNGAVRVIRTIMTKGVSPLGGSFSVDNSSTPASGPGEGSIALPIAVDVGLFSNGTLTFNNNATINSDIYSNNSVTLHGNTEAGKISSLGTITINNNSNVGELKSNGSVVINGQTITEKIFSNGSVTVNHNNAKTGDITAAGSITVWGGTTGVRTPNTPQTPLTPIAYSPPSSSNTNADLNRNTYFGGSALPTSSTALNGGIYYVGGNYTANNNVTMTGNAIIYIAGNLVFNNKASFTGNVTLLVEGTVTFHNSADFNNALILSGGTVTFNNGLDMNGAIITAGNMVLNNNATITYTTGGSGGSSSNIVLYNNQ